MVLKKKESTVIKEWGIGRRVSFKGSEVLTKLKPDIVTGANQRMKVAVNRVESFICDFEDVFSEFSM